MKHLYLTLLFAIVSTIIIGCAAGMIIQNNLTGVWFEFGIIENSCLLGWIPFAVLSRWQYRKHVRYVNGLKDEKMIKEIKVKNS